MPIPFTCPACGRSTQVDDRFAGQSGPCAGCGQTVTVPLAAGNGPLMTAPAMAAPMAPAPARSGMSGMSIVAIVLAILGAGAILVILVLVALLLPAVSAGREAARRVNCSNNMKQIALAMHNYHDKYGSFPPAYTVDANGKKLHSWRTLILPYLEQGVIYDQIDFNEPWDSPKNQAIGALPIKAFQCPSQDHSGLGSSYVVLTGPNTMFSSPKGTKLSEVTDGTSNTILIVEAAGVNSNWMEPTDLDMNLFVQGSAAKPPHAGSFNVGFADGAVRGMKGTLSAEERKALATRNGGEIVPMSP